MHNHFPGEHILNEAEEFLRHVCHMALRNVSTFFDSRIRILPAVGLSGSRQARVSTGHEKVEKMIAQARPFSRLVRLG
jgi:hypothetical protein